MSSCWACSYPSEFSEKYNSAALGDVDFVTLAHRLLLARDPSAEELQSYLHATLIGRAQPHRYLQAAACLLRLPHGTRASVHLSDAGSGTRRAAEGAALTAGGLERRRSYAALGTEPRRARRRSAPANGAKVRAHCSAAQVAAKPLHAANPHNYGAVSSEHS